MEQRAVIKFNAKLGRSASETYILMKQVYGTLCLSKSNVFIWHKRFSDGRNTLEDDKHAGRPSSSKTPESIEKVREFVANNRSASLRMVAEVLHINKETIRTILHEDLGKTKVCAKFVPHTLTGEQKSLRIAHCRDIISAYENDSNFLKSIVTDDETWCFHFSSFIFITMDRKKVCKKSSAKKKMMSIEVKREISTMDYDNPKRRKSWGKPGHASTSTAKPNIHGKKLMLCIWWDQLGVIYYELLQPNETITGERYEQQLMRLSRALKIKRPLYAKRHDKVIYQHDNARPHVAKVVKETLEALQWDVLPHPPYSPDIAPSDYHMFRSMTHGLAEQHYTSYEEAKNWVDAWIASKDEEFFRHGIRMLPERWGKVVAKDGQYFE
ncbi:hypothetical protein LAZ67_14001557 [Cordylochernes scorpioides]|uniref:Mos1 transposase HTH domain-containing protein n=1 Tax=Cordylochernes scorpioides TaxID=51811 RepID=A0ABY6L646_9ARAC|nr:hypothetical protein LAZ67_14001557 [Cordylochernes scorpioides]